MMMNKGKQIAVTGLLLMLFGIIGSAIVGVTFESTTDIIAENDRRAMLRTLNQILPAEHYDNDLIKDTVELAADGKLGQKRPSSAYIARKNNNMTAIIFSANAPDGYNGEIQLLVGINIDGTLAGVRVVKHNETPGLGDALETKRSDWIFTFTGKSLNQPESSQWKVKRDGGIFDQFTGATITPRAVVKAVKQCLIYFKRHKKALLNEDKQS
jgi:H+/Na+-translocating ferredoxin:NAD+ oxidoreductase subunit G